VRHLRFVSLHPFCHLSPSITSIHRHIGHFDQPCGCSPTPYPLLIPPSTHFPSFPPIQPSLPSRPYTHFAALDPSFSAPFQSKRSAQPFSRYLHFRPSLLFRTSTPFPCFPPIHHYPINLKLILEPSFGTFHLCLPCCHPCSHSLVICVLRLSRVISYQVKVISARDRHSHLTLCFLHVLMTGDNHNFSTLEMWGVL
jgi:hypothetical protein